MRQPPKPAKKFLAGSSLRSPDAADRDVATTPAPSQPTEEKPLAMTPGAIRERERRAARANARQQAKAATRWNTNPADFRNEPDEEETPKRIPQPQLVYMDPKSVEFKDARKQNGDAEDRRRVKPEGIGGGSSGGSRDRDDKVSVQPLHKWENQPTYRATVTFKVRMQESLDFLKRYMKRPPSEDTRREILQSLRGVLFEKLYGGAYHCHVCDFIDDWESNQIKHLERMVEEEIEAFKKEQQRVRDLREGLRDIIMPPGVTPIPVADAVLDTHARLFMEQIRMRDRHARKVRKAVKSAKSRTAQPPQKTGT